MKTYKKIEVIIKDFGNLNYEDVEKMKFGKFKVEFKFNNPVSNYSVKDGIEEFVGYSPPLNPVEFYLVLDDDE